MHDLIPPELAAIELNLPLTTLAMDRRNGRLGIPFYKLGRHVRYSRKYEINISFICNIQISPDGTVKNPGRRSRLFKLLKALSGRSQGNFNLDDLIGLECMSEVTTSTKDERKMDKPEDEQYSVISELSLEPANQDEVDEVDDLPF
jgi:hypothetical protein